MTFWAVKKYFGGYVKTLGKFTFETAETVEYATLFHTEQEAVEWAVEGDTVEVWQLSKVSEDTV